MMELRWSNSWKRNKEKEWASSGAYSMTEELVSEENTTGVWCLRVFGTAVKEAGRWERHSISFWSIRLTFTTIRNSGHCTFYESDDISRLERKILYQWKGRVNSMFKSNWLWAIWGRWTASSKRFPDCKIGFSKFAELIPKQCVLVVHTQYVCVQYIKMSSRCHSKCRYLSCQHTTTVWQRYCATLHILYAIWVNVMSVLGSRHSKLRTHFDETDVEQIVYKQWVSTNRSTSEILFTSSGICWYFLWEGRTLASPFIHRNRAGFILCSS